MTIHTVAIMRKKRMIRHIKAQSCPTRNRIITVLVPGFGENKHRKETIFSITAKDFTVHDASGFSLWTLSTTRSIFQPLQTKAQSSHLSYFLDMKSSLSLQPFPPFSHFLFLFLSFLFSLQLIPLFDKRNVTCSHSSRLLQVSCGAFPSASKEATFH